MTSTGYGCDDQDTVDLTDEERRVIEQTTNAAIAAANKYVDNELYEEERDRDRLEWQAMGSLEKKLAICAIVMCIALPLISLLVIVLIVTWIWFLIGGGLS